LSQSSEHKEHRDEQSSSSGSLAKQVYILYLPAAFARKVIKSVVFKRLVCSLNFSTSFCMCMGHARSLPCRVMVSMDGDEVGPTLFFGRRQYF